MSDSALDRLKAALSGRYRVERELGEGGMATVYLADDLKHERKVALKVLKPELAAVVGSERFLAEIKTTANLHHPHILPLFDSGAADSFLFYVMPYVDGETLGDRLKRERQLPVDEALGIATAVASALQHAHDRGVIHRDIKPGNILLQDGQPVVSDFGIALAVGAAGGARLTETGLSVGTPYYMSPEQATGDQVIGPSSDTFALACVTYEMLVGEPPYPGSTAQAVLGKIIQGAPVSATAVRPSIPHNVDAAIRKALEKLPADRFPGAADFAKALQDPGFRHGETAETAAAAAGAGRWKAVAGVFAVLAAGFAGLAGWALLDDGPPSAVERFGAPFLQGQQPLGTSVGSFMLAEDGSAAVYVGPGAPGTIQLFIRRWTELQSVPIRGTEGGNQPAISPDGTEVAFHRNSEIFVAPVGGGPVRTLGPGQWPRWSDDDHIFAMLGAVGSVRMPAAGGPRDTITTLRGEEQNHYVWDVLPGSDRALLLVGMGDATFQIRALDFDTGETRFLVEGEDPFYVETGHLIYRFEGALMGARFDARSMELTGPPTVLATDLTAHSISRSGRLLYTTGSSATTQRELVWVTRDGQMTPVDPSWTFTQGDVNASWRISPDGSQVVLREQNDGVYDLWVKQLDDGPRSRLTFDEQADYNAEWSPDGERIIWVAGPGTGLNVWSRRADGTGEPEQILDIEQSVATAAWSPDEEWLILRTTTGAGNVFGRDILAIRPGVDDEPRPLMTADYDEMDPVLSPDGRWIAYASNETGRFEVYVRPFPEVNSGRWQISTDGGHGPRWAHDGEEIFFKDANRNLAVAAVDGSGTAFQARSPQLLFPIPNDVFAGDLSSAFDVAPDDGRFLMARLVRSADDSGSELPDFVLVQNFDQELRTRLAR